MSNLEKAREELYTRIDEMPVHTSEKIALLGKLADYVSAVIYDCLNIQEP